MLGMLRQEPYGKENPKHPSPPTSAGTYHSRPGLVRSGGGTSNALPYAAPFAAPFLWTFNLFIFDTSVVGLIWSKAAAPSFP